MSSAANRRKTQRISVSVPTSIRLKSKPHEVIEGEVLSLSEGGAFVACAKSIPVGELVLLDIRFSESKVFEARITEMGIELEDAGLTGSPAQSVVRWSTQTQQPGFGVEFLALEPELREFLDKLVSYFQRLKKAGVTFEP